MKSKKKHSEQVDAGLTRMTKREEKAAKGYGRSGNLDLDTFRRRSGLLASHVKEKD